MIEIKSEIKKKVDTDKLYSQYETIQAQIAYQWIPDNCATILEIGCSSGYFTQKLRTKAKEVYGIDVNREHIQIAREKYPDIHFRAIEADTLPFEDKKFDAVVMLEVYEHVQNQQKLINEIYRILKPKGVLVLSTPNTGLFSFLDAFNLKITFKRALPRFTQFLEKNIQRYKNTQYTDNLDWHGHYSLDSLRKALENKFLIERVHRGGLLIFPLFAIVRSVLVRVIPSRFLFLLVVKIMNLDGIIPYGPWGYNLHIKARKT